MADPIALRRVDERRFAQAPMGAAHVGETLLVWADSPQLVGSAGWGVVPLDHIQAGIALWLGMWPRVADGVAVVTDMASFAPLPPETYAAFAEFSRLHLAAMAAKKARHLVLMPTRVTDVIRVMSVGFLAALGATHAHFVSADPAAGVAWLGAPAAAARIAETRAIIAEAERATWLVRRVRQAIEADLTRPDSELVARALGMSLRSLQRALAAEGTSFRDEVLAARIEHAAHLLTSSDDKVAAISSRVGFASPSHFTSLFRRLRGVTPDDFRRRG